MTRKAKVETESKKPAALGTKRACPKCSTKFYDFEREEGNCPKCGQLINFKELQEALLASLAAAPKKAKAKPVEEEESDTPAVVPGAAVLDELDDSPETSLEDLEVEEDEEEDY
jgi:uncharacterized protein (TIGR02300 family)